MGMGRVGLCGGLERDPKEVKKGEGRFGDGEGGGRDGWWSEKAFRVKGRRGGGRGKRDLEKR